MRNLFAKRAIETIRMCPRSDRPQLGAALCLIPLLLTAVLLAASPPATAQEFVLLHSLTRNDGNDPAGLIQGRDGSLYSAAAMGGPNASGTLFRLTIGSSAAFTTFHAFTFVDPHTTSNADGCTPTGIIQAADGNFYGVAMQGGPVEPIGFGGSGTIFKVTASGTFTRLYAFTAGTDGQSPTGSLIQATGDSFYGETINPYGSASQVLYGTLFRITSDGTFTTVYRFGGGADGNNPVGGLIRANDGNFYGVTEYGGNADTVGGPGYGTIFKMTPSGTVTTIYRFTGGANGARPLAGLIQATDGNLYGTTDSGGNGTGTIFKITLGGDFTTLYRFSALGNMSPFTNTDGAHPRALIQASDGNLYGMTEAGGPNGFGGYGTIFKVTRSGNLTTLYSFKGESDGLHPQSGLLQASNGRLYGSATGGDNGYGTLFSLDVGLRP